jgi:hypothetical protein
MPITPEAHPAPYRYESHEMPSERQVAGISTSDTDKVLLISSAERARALHFAVSLLRHDLIHAPELENVVLPP